MSLYSDLVAAGVPVDSHYSDLYAKATPQTYALARQHGVTGKTFVSNVDGALWVDFPFQFTPFWDAVSRRSAATPTPERD